MSQPVVATPQGVPSDTAEDAERPLGGTPPAEAELVSATRATPSEVAAEARAAATEGARVVASRSVAAAEAAMRTVRGSIEEASRRMDEERAEWERIAERSSLPDIDAADPIAGLAVRIDREGAFWRAFAIRAMRPGAPRAIATATAALGLLGGLGLATIGALGGLLGAAATAAHLWAAAGALAIGSAIAIVGSAWLDRTNGRAAAEALGRADDAERRLSRVAAILALKRADETAYREALARLERG